MTKAAKWVNMLKSHRTLGWRFTFATRPHSPCQRGSNENTNGLIRQYLPKGTDFSVHRQEALDAILYQMNIRPRKRFGYKCPVEVITEVMGMYHAAPALNQ